MRMSKDKIKTKNKADIKNERQINLKLTARKGNF